MAKTIPTNKQIKDFMEVFEKSASKDNALLVDNNIAEDNRSAFDDENLQAFRKYGTFLALVGEENYQSVSQKLVNELVLYKLASNGQLSMELNTDLAQNDLAFLKETMNIFPPLTILKQFYGDREHDYEKLISLLKVAIMDLENFNAHSIRKILPSTRYRVKAKRTKKRIRDCIDEIMKQYNIHGYSGDAKKLKDAIFESIPEID